MKKDSRTYLWNNNNFEYKDFYELNNLKTGESVLDISISENNEYIDIIGMGIYSLWQCKKVYKQFKKNYIRLHPKKKIFATFLVEGDLLGKYIYKKLGFTTSVVERKCIRVDKKVMNRIIMITYLEEDKES